MSGVAKFFRGILIFVLVIVLIGFAVIIAANMVTPEMVGIGDLGLGGVTLRDLGLADKSFFAIVKMGYQVMNEPPQEKVVVAEDAPTENDYESVEEKVVSGEKEINYGSLMAEKLVLAEPKPITLTNSELTALFNLSCEGFMSSGEGDEFMSLYTSMNPVFESMSLSKSGINLTISVVTSVDLPEDMKASLGAAAAFLPSKLYITFTNTYSISGGNLTDIPAEDSLLINSMSKEQSDTIVTMIAGFVGGISTDGDVSQNFCDTLGSLVSQVFNNMGQIVDHKDGTTTILLGA